LEVKVGDKSTVKGATLSEGYHLNFGTPPTLTLYHY
jgi:hypothetical protein